MSEPRFLTIAVSEPKKNEETLGQFVSYKITSETNWEGYTETNCTVARRYSDFAWLYETLSLSMPGCIIPAIPPKQSVGRFLNDFVQERRRSLEHFLVKISEHSDLCNSDYLKVFLQADDDGMKQAMKLSQSLKPKRLSLVGNTVQSAWTLYVGNSGKTAELKNSDTDNRLTEIFNYILNLEGIMFKMCENASLLVARGTKTARAEHDVASSFMSLGVAEGDSLGNALSQIGRDIDVLSAATGKNANNQMMKFIEPMNEYARNLESVKLALSQRNEKRSQYVAELTKQEVNEAAFNKVSMQPGKEQAAQASEIKIQQQQEVVGLVKSEFDIITERLLRDFTQFQIKKTQDIKDMLESFVEMQVEYHKEQAQTWSSLPATLTQIQPPSQNGSPVSPVVVEAGSTDQVVTGNDANIANERAIQPATGSTPFDGDSDEENAEV